MSETMRTCSRTACRWPAAASLSYRYATSSVWLLDLAAERDPSLYDLCPHHADTLRVPRGWERVDLRSHPPAVVEPSAEELAASRGERRTAHGATGGEDVATRPTARQRRAVSRYDQLCRDLPRLAAALADPGRGDAERAGARQAELPFDTAASEATRRVVPARDLAPVAVEVKA